jgi:hypothetical protein
VDESCGTFDDMYAGHLEIAGMTTRDAEGNPVRDNDEPE